MNWGYEPSPGAVFRPFNGAGATAFQGYMMTTIPIGARVELVESAQQGTVVGQASYEDGTRQVLVRYKNAEGDQEREWFPVADVQEI